MANSQAVCTSFKQELMLGAHQLGTVTLVSRSSLTAPTTDTLKASLRLATDSSGAGTTSYSSTGELAASGNYSAGGVTVTNGNAPATSGTTAYWTPSAAFAWTALTSSGAFDAVLLYNSTQSNRAVAVYTFGSQSVTAGNFSLTMPSNAAGTALLQIT